MDSPQSQKPERDFQLENLNKTRKLVMKICLKDHPFFSLTHENTIEEIEKTIQIMAVEK